MCDYSLMAVPNRLAQQGEELVTHRFPTGSLGLAAPDDVRRVSEPRPAVRRSIWQRVREYFDPPAACAVCAVCIPPGTRLQICDIPARLQERWGVSSQADAVFTQISATVNYYRDAVRFADGREVRLQELREGMRVQVLDLTGTEEPALESLAALG